MGGAVSYERGTPVRVTMQLHATISMADHMAAVLCGYLGAKGT